jgi:UDP-N-acetylmuramate dehydrogenase
VVLFAAGQGLAGLESMMRIPGWLGGAVYGNAGAYGQSLHEVISRVEIFDGRSRRWLTNAECGFRYRTSAFKQNKHWIVLNAELRLLEGDSAALQARAEEIRSIRDAKFPPTMKCAGSIFKNCLFAQLPESAQRRVPSNLVREGKVSSAFFLEHVGAKGTVNGGIHVADYHANLIYNAGGGTAQQVLEIIDDLKARVTAEFGFTPEEEVQFIGFPERPSY